MRRSWRLVDKEPVLAPEPARDAYQRLAPTYDLYTEAYDYDRWLAELEELAREHGVRGRRLLDVACGTGNFTRNFAGTVGESGLVVGIDVSQTMLRRAVEDTRRAGLAQVAYVRGDATELPFRDASFDAVCCFAALNLMTDPMRALDHMTAALSPGGRIALFTSCRGRSAPLRTLESLLVARSGLRMFERDELTDALEERGFVEIHQRITGLTQFVGGRLAGNSGEATVFPPLAASRPP